jgi:hypothetical protein
MGIGFAATACAVVVAAGGLAGCAGSNSGATRPAAAHAQIRCNGIPTSGSATDARPCVLVLSDGTRFRCPQDFAHMVGDTLQLAGTCRRLAPVAVPLSWRVVLAALARMRSCLTSRGLRVAGGPSLGLPSNSPQTPLGELSIENGATPTLIEFYASSPVAQQLEPSAIEKVKPFGHVERHDEAIILWTGRPTSAQRMLTEACVSA